MPRPVRPRPARPSALPATVLAAVAAGPAHAGGLLDNSVTWVNGDVEQEKVGRMVAAVGDVDGDGVDDFLVGASGWEADTGRALLFAGRAFGWTRPFTRADALAVLTGQHEGDLFAEFGDGLGDFNGDGLDDFAVSAFGWYPSAGNLTGAVALYLGRPRGEAWPAALTAADAFFVGPTNGQAGRAVAGIGDLDGDGFADLAIGAPYADTAKGVANDGAIYIVYGSADPADVTLDAAPTIIAGTTEAVNFGMGVRGVGDVDGDGFPDFAVGAPADDTVADRSGAIYLFRGGARLGAWLTPLDAFAVIRGEGEHREAATQFASAGDFDGDGHADLAIGDKHPNLAGFGVAAWVFKGGPAGRFAGPAEWLLSDADALVGVAGTDSGLGTPVDFVRDQDGDGRDELILGFKEYLEGPGGVVVGHGRAFEEGVQVVAEVDLYDGERCEDSWCQDFAGHAASRAGDLDGDGVEDLLVGAPDHGEDEHGAGRVYAVSFGPARTDDDGDGVSEWDGDCDDTRAEVVPTAESDGCDELDNDCDGAVDEDCVPETDDDTTPAGDDDSAGDTEPEPEECGGCEATGGQAGPDAGKAAGGAVALGVGLGLRRRRG